MTLKMQITQFFSSAVAIPEKKKDKAAVFLGGDWGQQLSNKLSHDTLGI
jgi:hypothetical protein